MKKILILSCILLTLSSFSILLRSSAPPQGYTGATGAYCSTAGCHSTNPLNNPGGSIVATGLPADTYTPGTAYNFSIAISHSDATTRKRFGFSIKAVNSSGATVGTFSSTNANAALNGQELSHLNAPSLATAQQSYTFANLKWTAPSNPTAADQTITFYFVGNAANNSGSAAGDFIYASTQSASLQSTTTTYTFNGNGNWDNPVNWSNGIVPPATISGSNAVIIIDPVANGECVLNVPQTIGSNANITVNAGKKFRVNGNLTINN